MDEWGSLRMRKRLLERRREWKRKEGKTGKRGKGNMRKNRKGKEKKGNRKRIKQCKVGYKANVIGGLF